MFSGVTRIWGVKNALLKTLMVYCALPALKRAHHRATKTNIHCENVKRFEMHQPVKCGPALPLTVVCLRASRRKYLERAPGFGVDLLQVHVSGPASAMPWFSPVLRRADMLTITHRPFVSCCSDRWMAPEVIRHEPYDQAADVYSFGEEGS